MAIYKNLIVGCSLGVVTLLILISTQLSNTIIPTRNVTSTQEPPPIIPQWYIIKLLILNNLHQKILL